MSEDYVIHEEIYKGYTIRIKPDDDASDPREFDNLGTMVTAHRRYTLGDYQVGNHPDYPDVDSLLQLVHRPDVISLPLYLYEHGGMTMRTYPFNDPWDSGQVGYIFVTYAELRKEFHWKHITNKRIQRVLTLLRGEVSTYNSYISGDAVGWVVSNEEDDHIESVWGYLSYDPSDGMLRGQGSTGEDQAIEDARACIDALVKIEIKQGIQPYLPGTETHFPHEVAVLMEKLS